VNPSATNYSLASTLSNNISTFPAPLPPDPTKIEGYITPNTPEAAIWLASEKLNTYFLNEWYHFFPELLEKGSRRRAAAVSLSARSGGNKETGTEGEREGKRRKI
jgi:hypothetical protein